MPSSKFLVVNSKNRRSNEKSSNFSVNFSDSLYIDRGVVQISPIMVNFRNDFYNVIAGWNDQFYAQYAPLAADPVFGEVVLVTITPGFYNYKTLFLHMMETLKAIPYFQLNENDQMGADASILNGKLTLWAELYAEVNKIEKLRISSHNESIRSLRLFQMFGGGKDSLPHEAGIKDYQYEFKGIPGGGKDKMDECKHMPAFNWNDICYINCNITEGSCIEQQESKNACMGSLLAVVPINVPFACSQSVLYQDYDANKITFNGSQNLSEIKIQLRTKFGTLQGLPNDHISILTLRIVNIDV